MDRLNNFKISNVLDYLPYLSSYALGLIFLVSGTRKILNFEIFMHALEGYRLIPSWLVSNLGVVIVAVEIFVGIGLFVSSWQRMALLSASFLLSLFLLGISVEYWNDSNSLCGCLAFSNDQRISLFHIIQNVGLIATASITFVVVKNRNVKQQAIERTVSK